MERVPETVGFQPDTNPIERETAFLLRPIEERNEPLGGSFRFGILDGKEGIRWIERDGPERKGMGEISETGSEEES
eukprot:scaffold738_cov340-Pavlova_lutheri.AAC.24